jgi:hypothetical protein
MKSAMMRCVASSKRQISFGLFVPWTRNIGQKAPNWNQRVKSSAYFGSAGSPPKNPPMSVFQ